MPKDDISFSDYRYIANPIDAIEEMIITQDWPYHRMGTESIVMEIPSRWGDYRLQFVWQKELKTLQMTCVLDIKLDPGSLPAAYELLSSVNEQVILGHFELSSEDCVIAYRYCFLLSDVRSLNGEYLEELVEFAFEECERFYPAFQTVLQDGKSTKEAMTLALLDTMGEA